MSWIQNLFQKFIKEEEGESKESILQKHPGQQLPPLGQTDKIKDVDARISYQYPKGHNLRSQSPKVLQKDTKEPKYQNKATIESEKPKAVRKQVEPPIKKELPKNMFGPPIKKGLSKSLVEPPIKELSKSLVEPSYKTRKPFHPTEIPSPVYGFNRPKQTDEQTDEIIIEHELSHFLQDDVNHLQSPLISQGEVSMETVSAAPVERIEKVEEDHSIHVEASEQVIAAPLTEVSVTVEEITSAIEEAENEQSAAAEVEIKEDADSESELPKRSRLPFNVMMLKQDKLKLEERKRIREPEHKLMFLAEKKQTQELKRGSVLLAPKVEAEKQVSEQPSMLEAEKQVSEQTLMVEAEKQVSEQTLMLEAEKQVSEQASMMEMRNQQLSEQPRRLEAEKQVLEQPPILEVRGISQQSSHFAEKTVSQESVLLKEDQENCTYVFPKSNLLSPPVAESQDTTWIEEQKELLNVTLQNFNVGASVVNVTQGPSVTRFEVQPEPGVKVNKITNLSDDIKLSLAARDVRMEAPIPGKHTIGIEVPNQKSRPVLINEIIGSSVFNESDSPLTAVLGLDIAGKPIVTDLKKMPHGLIAGATGSGKSVCINSILISLLYKARPEDLKLLLIDPKMVELAPYNRIPHLVSPVITDVKAATAALKWAVEEMERRYELFAHTGVRDINRFNSLAMEHKRYSDKLPFIVIIIDELADLMMMSPADVEEAICRIAQKARACGIHLIVATQRPSVDVITGLIKANIPTRIAFSVSSQVDSRTIIDISGAEKLLGRGDMLFLENGSSKPVRLQGTFVSDEEIDLVVAHVREQREPEYLFEQEELLKKAQVVEDEDELFYEACEFIVEHGGASTSSLQRRFKIGYNRAARLMDMLEQNGYISSANGSKPREVFITEADLQSIQD